MLYTENSQRTIQYRPSSSSSPLLARSTRLGTTCLKRSPTNTLNSTKSFKPIKIMRSETIKKAKDDTFMAAASGDVEWLKKTFKISEDMRLEKNVIYFFYL
jgi:hypothetical protein